MTTCKAPKERPPVWQILKNGPMETLSRTYPDGLGVSVSIETYNGNEDDLPPMGAGEYLHISLSRHDRYPKWDEMKAFIYSSSTVAWIDRKRDVVMVLPPIGKYVNFHRNCFHFYQKKEK